MTRKRWATPAENEWLTHKIPAYRAAQLDGKVTQFNIEVIAAFFQAFPERALTGSGGIDGAQANDGNVRDGESVLAPDVQRTKIVHPHTLPSC